MSIARSTHDTIFRDLRQSAPWEDLRRLRTLAWAVTGLILEQDARVACQALASDAPEAMNARVRRMERLLASALDPHRLYGAILQPHLARWNGRTAWLALDTSSLRDRAWFVRLGLCYRHRAIPIAWRAYPGHSSTVGIDVYQQVLEQADRMLPQCARRCLLADRGFAHVELIDWCLRHGWSYRVVAKRNTLITLPGRAPKAIKDFRCRLGAVRFLHTVYLAREQLGPAGLLLSWPPYYPDRTLHVISDDAPGLFAPPDILRRTGIEEAFHDDKRGGFDLEAVHIASPHCLDRLLLVLALAYLYLVTTGDDLVDRRERGLIEPGDAYSLSRFQLGCRFIRRTAWRGKAAPLRIYLQPDPPALDLAAAERTARHAHHRLGLTPGHRWVPYRSFESENAYWWLPAASSRASPTTCGADSACFHVTLMGMRLGRTQSRACTPRLIKSVGLSAPRLFWQSVPGLWRNSTHAPSNHSTTRSNSPKSRLSPKS